jgi:hypothetical protein
MPRLKPGVLVHIHDILLPYDYPPSYTNFYYSKQYLLATFLLAKGQDVNMFLPMPLSLTMKN